MVNENLGQETRIALDHIIDELGKMPIGLPLVWLYVWDVVKHQYESYSEGDAYVVNESYTIDDVWNALWENPVFTLEYGVESLDEHVCDWLVEHNFIVDEQDLDMVKSEAE